MIDFSVIGILKNGSGFENFYQGDQSSDRAYRKKYTFPLQKTFLFMKNYKKKFTWQKYNKYYYLDYLNPSLR